jgi:hypothetical protein
MSVFDGCIDGRFDERVGERIERVPALMAKRWRRSEIRRNDASPQSAGPLGPQTLR